MSYGLTRHLRVGVNGYYLQQLSNDTLQGRDIAQSQERAFGLGPGLVYITPAIIFMVNSFVEFGVENRPQGFRLQGRFVYTFSR
jgi:anthranilate 1,2-dioxygenase (deaminating, decarboxylating) large subunit